jgi:hypothetical protein
VHEGTYISKQTINHYELPKYKSNNFQATVIKVKMTQYELTVAAVYCPPKYNIKKKENLNMSFKRWDTSL